MQCILRLLSDTASHGSVLILLNYLLVMVGLCVGVATAVLYWVPNNYTGLIMSGKFYFKIYLTFLFPLCNIFFCGLIISSINGLSGKLSTFAP